MSELRLEEIQGVLLSGYSKLKHCSYLLLQINDASSFKLFLQSTPFQDTKTRPETTCYNIAFTQTGLQKLGVDVNEKNGFSLDFIEGMDSKHKQRLLGDVGQSSPDKWQWGNTAHPVDCLLMVFSLSDELLDQETNLLFSSAAANGFQEVSSIKSQLLEGKEHFGFNDGISQPKVKGFPPSKNLTNTVNTLNPGEFILGYDNNYDIKPLSPTLNGLDFGSDGTYLVMRQLEQDTNLFWRSMMEYANQQKDEAIELASKIVGRWPNGNPLTLFEENTEKSKEQNNFNFYDQDRDGLKCPLGSHIRRSNPRDSIDDAPDQSIDMVNKHRILRRGRPYGPPVDPDMDVKKMIDAPQDDHKRGLIFICMNTDISRQFDFVQGHWINNRKFNDFYNDVDPLMGSSPTEDSIEFEIQDRPIRKRITDIPEFVTVVGGAYFFLPKMSTITYLSE